MDDFLIATLGSEVVRYYPSLAKYVGGAKTALFLSQIIYWNYNPKMQDRLKNNGGWFFISVKEMENQTGLTKSEQVSARKDLEGIVETSLKGRSPMTLHYRLNVENLNNRISQLSEKQQISLQESGELVCRNPANFNTDTTETNKDIKGVKASQNFEIYKSVLELFAKLTGRKIPNDGTPEWYDWDKGVMAIINEADGDLSLIKPAMTKAIQTHIDRGISTSNPGSIRKTTLDLIGKLRVGVDINKTVKQKDNPVNEPKSFAAIREYIAMEKKNG